MGGATTYMSESNLVGLYRELKDAVKNGTVPDHIIFNGELLPEVPDYASKSGLPKLLVLGDFVSDLDSACVAMKPHMSRIANLMDIAVKRNNITYVMSESDRQSIISKYTILQDVYNRKPERILDFYFSILEKVEAENEILEKTEKTANYYSHQSGSAQDEEFENDERSEMQEIWRSTTAEEKSSNEAKLATMQKKMAAHREEIREYEEIATKYLGLLRLWFEENKDMDIGAVFKKFRKYSHTDIFTYLYYDSVSSEKKEKIESMLKHQYEDASKKLAAEQAKSEKDAEKIAKLEDSVKALGNLIEKKGYDKINKLTQKVAKENANRGVSIFIKRFAGLLPGSKEFAQRATDIASSEVLKNIRDVFGRRTKLNIIMDQPSVININGLKVLVSHDPNPDSKMIKKDYANAIKHWLYTTDEKVDLAITAHSFKGFEETYPARNRSADYVHTVVLPPFVDRKALGKAYARGNRTSFVKAIGKMPVSSGFYKISHDGYTFDTEFHTSEYLKMLSEKEHHDQLRALSSNLRSLRPVTITSDMLDEKEKAQILAKLPSELSNRLLNEYLILHGIKPTDKRGIEELRHGITGELSPSHIKSSEIRGLAKELLRTESREPKELKRMNFVVITDTHIGSPGMGMPATQILDGIVNYISKSNNLKEYSLLLLGDNIEGNLRNHQNEANIEKDPLNPERFADFLEQKGYAKGSAQFVKHMNAYKAHLLDITPFQNSDSQADKLLEHIRPLLESSAQKVVAVVEVSGNHPNKTYADRSLDEATKLRRRIEDITGKKIPVRFVPGGDVGVDRVPINGKEFFIIHRMNKDTSGIVDKQGINATVFSGDKHVYRKDIVDNQFMLTSPCLQGRGTFAESIGIPVSDSLRGFTITSLYYDNEHQNPVVSNSRFVTLKELRERGCVPKDNPLISEFETKLKEVNFENKPIKAIRH